MRRPLTVPPSWSCPSFAEIGQILQISARKRLEHPVRRPCEIDCQGDPGGARLIGHQGIEAALGMENELVRCAQVDLQVLEPIALGVAHQPAGGSDRAELAGLFVDQRQRGALSVIVALKEAGAPAAKRDRRRACRSAPDPRPTGPRTCSRRPSAP